MTPEERRAFVCGHRTAVFGYGRAADGPAMSIVYYVMDGDDILVSTMGERAKARAVARHPKVSLCVLDEAWPPTYLQVYCDATIDHDRERTVDLMMRIAGVMADRPLDESIRPLVAEGAEREGRVVLRLRPYATFETPPRHVESEDDVDESLTHCDQRVAALGRVMGAAPPDAVDVAIVGCGPVGAVLGNLLGGLGRRVTIVERETEVYRLPRAVHFDGEIMRVFQSLGLAAAIAPCSAPITGMDFVDAAGARLMGYVAPPGDGPSGWASDYMFHQPELERTLRAGLDRYPDVELRLGTEVRALRPHDDHVDVVLPDTTIRAAYVVGTDGARSLTRAAIGTTLDDYGFDQPWLVVDAVRRRPLDLPAAVVQYCDPARPATFVPPGGPHCRWELMVLPGEDHSALLDPARVAELLAPWVQPGDVEITRAAVYTFHALVAREWRHDRLLVAGDSAHQMPPFLGQGMCAGIRDAANLAWKLAAVLHDGAPDRLLDTYQSEREPHVRAVIEAAVTAGSIIQTTDPDLARDRDEHLRADGSAEPPELALPPLGPGVHRSAGVPLPQCDGSDAQLGPGPTLVAARPVAVEGVVVLPHLADWLAARDADVALVRPDRYVFGTAAAADVDTLVAALHAHLV